MSLLTRETVQAMILAGDTAGVSLLFNELISESLAQALVDSGKKKKLTLNGAKVFLHSPDFAHLLNRTEKLHPSLAALGFLNFILDSDTPKVQEKRARDLVESGAMRRLAVNKEVAPALTRQMVHRELNASELETEQKKISEGVHKEYVHILHSLLSSL